MFFFKKLLLFTLIILICSCTVKNFENTQIFDDYSIEIETPDDEYNLYLKESLKRYFQISNNKKKYILSAKITFETTKTLSVDGQNILKSTKARIDYQLINKNTNVVKSGSINTFPALSSSSNSLYTQEKSINHIKERLTKSSAKSLHKRIKIIIRRLN